MSKKYFGFFTSILILTIIFSVHSSFGFFTQDTRVLDSSDQGVTFEIIPQKWYSSDKKINGEDYQFLTFSGADYFGRPGEPEVPVRVVILGVPLNSNVRVDVIDSQFDQLTEATLVPVPKVQKDSLAISYEYHPNEEIYNQATPYPQNILSVGEPHLFRSQRVIRIMVYGLQFFPQQKVIRKFHKITVKVSFSGTGEKQQSAPMLSRDESLYEDLLLNYRQAKKWRKPPSRPLNKPTLTFQGADWYKIILRTTSDGMFKITGKYLADKGIAIGSIDPKTIQIFGNGGRELPLDIDTARPDSLIENAITVVTKQPGRFDNDDYILFFGKSIEGWEYNRSEGRFRHYINHYGFENTYWLTFGNKEGKRISATQSLPLISLPPETSFRDQAFLEEDRQNVWGSGRDWFGRNFTMTEGNREYTFNFSLPGAVPSDSTYFNFLLVGASFGDHQFELFANGNSLGSTKRSGYPGSYVFIPFEQRTNGVLVDGNNAIQVKYTGDGEVSLAYLDWIEIDYGRLFQAVDDQLFFNAPLKAGSAAYQISGFSRNDIEVYDVSEFADVKRISDTQIQNGVVSFADECDPTRPKRYLAITSNAHRGITNLLTHSPRNLRTPHTADYIIITHDDFLQQAEELASLRENRSDPDERLETEVVPISAIYDEFSWGLVDPAAVRDFLKYAQDNWGSPRYVLLFGDGHYDYKNILGLDRGNWILPYETTNTGETSTRTTDDWFVYTRGPSAGIQMAIGRITVNSPTEAQNIVDKTIAYETDPEYGDWRNIFTMVADDEASPKAKNETFHTTDAERIVEDHVPDSFNLSKIYLMEYSSVSSASISWVMKPAANEVLMQQLNRGTLIVNFIGHGAAQLWTHERILNKPRDFDRIQNEKRLTFWIAASCDFSHWDNPREQSMPEDLLVVKDRGAIGTFASARLAFANSNAALNSYFLDFLFKPYAASGKLARLGDALMLAKPYGGMRENSEKYLILGDPALRLSAPRYKVNIANIHPDSIQALKKMTITGQVNKGEELWNDYNGRVLVKTFDSKRPRTYVTASGTEVNYLLPGNPVFRGVVPVKNGRFKVSFIVPKDITYGGTQGRVSAYVWGEQEDGIGYQDNIPVGGTATDLVDHEGPNIRLHFGENEFMAGDYTNQNPILYADISDSLSGVNIAGDIGHKMTLVTDGAEENKKDITEFFQYKEGSYTDGVLRYPMYDLDEGPHTVLLKAWDNSNNASTAETEFTVIADTLLKIRNVLTYPNPMTNATNFTFELSQNAEVSIKLYSVAGRLLRNFGPFYVEVGFNVLPEVWEGTDQDGDPLANGVYLYKVIAKARRGDEELKAEKIEKLVIAR